MTIDRTFIFGRALVTGAVFGVGWLLKSGLAPGIMFGTLAAVGWMAAALLLKRLR